jgi:precorrin-3B synthase
VPTPLVRSRRDRCPGVLRPWPAADGALVRIRLVGGRVSPAALAGLSSVAGRYGDGRLHLTRRANLQLRALPADDGLLPDEVVAAIEATGLLPSRTHELARNIMVSPGTGLAGGRTDLRAAADELDERLRADPALASLPGRFLFVLDDGRGDLVDRPTDLGLAALDAGTCQLRVASAWGPVVSLARAPADLVALARDFQRVRGDAPDAPWHVAELARPLVDPRPPDPRVPAAGDPPSYGPVDGGEHVPAPDGVVDADLAAALVARERDLVVTPWHGVLVPVR